MATSGRRVKMIALVVATAGLGLPAVATAVASENVMPYVVVTAANDAAVTAAKLEISRNGGTVVHGYNSIGVLIAYSAKDDFGQKLRAGKGIEKVGKTRTAKIASSFFDKPSKDPEYVGEDESESGIPAEGEAWDVDAIGTNAAHKITTGSKDVVVGVLDSGVDDTHLDLKDAVDDTKSVGCVTGSPTQEHHAWRPVLSDHGTHVAGTIAAARNGKGVVGVAPGVTLAAVKTGENRMAFPEGVICGFVWAAEHGFKVANASFYVDPWRFNCPGETDQAAIKEAVGRSVHYARSNGMMVVAAAGNEATDLANKTTDTKSPNDVEGKERTRDVANECVKLPAELPGVVAVSAIDSGRKITEFSDFGLGKIYLTAPGKDIWSTLPNGKYGPKPGTSMAAPHVSGVAALIAGLHPAWDAYDIWNRLQASATVDTVTCRTADECEAKAKTFNTFYGAGLVNAAAAVQ